MQGLIGYKVGMTSILTEEGSFIPVTVIEIKTNYVTQIKKLEKDGYYAVQVTTGCKKSSRIIKPEIGHFAKSGVTVGIGLWEFKVEKENVDSLNIGSSININIFNDVKKVDVTGTSKGKGFAGTVKRWHFHTQDASHGNSLSHRVPGSIGQNQTPGKVFKGKKMAGQLGNKRITIQKLDVIKIDTNKNVLLVKGSIPGSIGSNVIVKPSIKM